MARRGGAVRGKAARGAVGNAAAPAPAVAAERLVRYVALIAVATALVYAPALRNDFVNWDDGPYVYQNASLHEWSGSALAAHFVTRDPVRGWTLPRVMGNYHPLTMLSLHVDRHLSASDPAPPPGGETELHAVVFHATSVALHVANTLLVFFIARGLLRLSAERAAAPLAIGATRLAFLTALLFGIATQHVESVAWVSERKDVLYAFFFFLSLLAWLEYVKAGARRWYAFALATFALALLSKGQAVTLAVVLPAIDILLRRPLRGRVLLEKVPFLLLALVFGLLAVRSQADVLFVADAIQPWWLRPLFAAYGFVHSLVRLFVPIGLQAHYNYAQALGRPVLLYLLCPAAAAIFGVALARLWRREFRLVFGPLFFALGLTPVLQLLPVGTAVMADRYTYVASFGLFLTVALLADRASARWPDRRRWLAGALAAYAVLMGGATLARVAVWRNSETLWTEELRHDPRSARAHNNLGIAVQKRGAYAEAEGHFRTAVEIDPDNVEPWNNLATALVHQRRRAEAVKAFEQALKRRPAFVLARTNLADTLRALGDVEAAVTHYREALRVQPRYHVARGALIDTLRGLRRSGEAETECRAGLALEPGSLRYMYELARLLVARGAHTEGLPLLERVHAGAPQWGEATAALASAWNDVAVAARREGRPREAEEHFRRALQADPASATAHANLGALLAARGAEEDAAAHLREAARLRPDDADHARALAWLLATAREPRVHVPGEARRTAERAVALTGGRDALALYALGLAESAEGDARRAAATLGRALAAAMAGGDTALAGDLRRELGRRSSGQD
jgi:tetratricopeptide (TPR) repeat protein